MSSMYKNVDFIQPDSFQFSIENTKLIQEILTHYPKDNPRGAVMSLLYLAQKQHNNWIPKAAMDLIAKLLEMEPIHVYEVANFYTMYNKQPVGQYLIQICKTTPCWLKGSDDILNTCRMKLGIDIGETSKDKKFTIVEVECLGACVNGPVVQINDQYYENLDSKKMNKVIETHCK